MGEARRWTLGGARIANSPYTAGFVEVTRVDAGPTVGAGEVVEVVAVEDALLREDVERVLREQAAAARSLIDECRRKLDGYGEARQLVTLLALDSVAERLGLDIDNDGREDG